MAGPPDAPNFIPLEHSGAAAYHHVPFPSSSDFGSAGDALQDLTTVAPTLPLIEIGLGHHGVSDAASVPMFTVLRKSAVCNLRLERSTPSLIGLVAPPPPPSKVVLLQCCPPHDAEYRSGPTSNGPTYNMASDMVAAFSGSTTCPLHPDMDIPSHHVSTVVDAFNVDLVDTCVPAPALDRKESFDFPVFSEWDEVDGLIASGFITAMDVCNKENAPAHVLDQVSKLECMVSDDSMGPLHLNQSQIPGLASPTSWPPSGPASPAHMEDTIYSGAVSDPIAMTSNLHLEGAVGLIDSPPLVSPTASHGAVDTHESFHDVKDMGSVHGGNQAAITFNKTEFYRRKDRLTWRKHGQGGIKITKRPRSTSPSATTHGGAFEDMDPMYDGLKVRLRLETENINLDDGFVWSKYGEKPIIKHKHPRSYLRCCQSMQTKCKALKRIQRCSDNEDSVDILYLGRHNHPS